MGEVLKSYPTPTSSIKEGALRPFIHMKHCERCTTPDNEFYRYCELAGVMFNKTVMDFLKEHMYLTNTQINKLSVFIEHALNKETTDVA